MGTGPKILIVDDDREFCDEIKICLNSMGYENVSVSNTADRALAFIRTNKPDIILLDIVMPGLDGDVLAEKLQQDSSTRDIPVIFVTAIVTPEEARSYREKQGTLYRYFVSKPIDPSELKKQIDQLLKEKSQGRF